MKINPIISSNVIQSYGAGKIRSTERTASAYGSDEVSFSKEALSFSKLMSELKEQVEVSGADRQERIDELKTAVQNGSYRVDSGRVADSILGYLNHGNV